MATDPAVTRCADPGCRAHAPLLELVNAGEAMIETYDASCPDWWPPAIDRLRAALKPFTEEPPT